MASRTDSASRQCDGAFCYSVRIVARHVLTNFDRVLTRSAKHGLERRVSSVHHRRRSHIHRKAKEGHLQKLVGWDERVFEAGPTYQRVYDVVVSAITRSLEVTQPNPYRFSYNREL